MSEFAEKNGVEFELNEYEGSILTVIATEGNKEVGRCYVNKDGEFFGHDGFFATGFSDPEVEKFAQDVFWTDIENWVNK